jgi:hypothetical protein
MYERSAAERELEQSAGEARAGFDQREQRCAR